MEWEEAIAAYERSTFLLRAKHDGNESAVRYPTAVQLLGGYYQSIFELPSRHKGDNTRWKDEWEALFADHLSVANSHGRRNRQYTKVYIIGFVCNAVMWKDESPLQQRSEPGSLCIAAPFTCTNVSLARCTRHRQILITVTERRHHRTIQEQVNGQSNTRTGGSIFIIDATTGTNGFGVITKHLADALGFESCDGSFVIYTHTFTKLLADTMGARVACSYRTLARARYDVVLCLRRTRNTGCLLSLWSGSPGLRRVRTTVVSTDANYLVATELFRTIEHVRWRGSRNETSLNEVLCAAAVVYRPHTFMMGRASWQDSEWKGGQNRGGRTACMTETLILDY
ncbi:hypothetical protein CBL_01115 [Carabus blaptoides fortunei]